MRKPTEKRIQEYLKDRGISDIKNDYKKLLEFIRMGGENYSEFYSFVEKNGKDFDIMRQACMLNALISNGYSIENREIKGEQITLIKIDKITTIDGCRKSFSKNRIEILDKYQCNWSTKKNKVSSLIHKLKENWVLIRENKFNVGGSIKDLRKGSKHKIAYYIDTKKAKEYFGMDFYKLMNFVMLFDEDFYKFLFEGFIEKKLKKNASKLVK